MASQPIILKLARPARRRLEKLARKTRDKILFRHCQIILQLAQRQTPQTIAQALGCSLATVYRTRQGYLKHTEAGLHPKPRSGRPPTLTPSDDRRLDRTIEHEPRALGKNFSNWTAKRLALHLNWCVAATTVLRHLWALGWRWRRPVQRIASPDPHYAAKARYLRRLRQQARKQQIQLYYADEMDVALLPTISGRWMRRGHQTQVFTPGKNAKQYVFGAVNYITGALVWLPWANKNNVGFRQLLKQLLALHENDTQKVVVVLDNFRIHKAKAVQAWLQTQRQHLRLYFLPTYAPRLNPIERVWRHFRRNVTHDYFFRTMTRLMAAVESFLSELAESPAVILSIVA